MVMHWIGIEVYWVGAKETIGDQRGSSSICVLSKETRLGELLHVNCMFNCDCHAK